MDNLDNKLQGYRLSRSALELIEGLGSAEDCWDVCVDRLGALGVNSVLYGFVVSKLDIERVGFTNACHLKTNHNPVWINQLEEYGLLDNDMTAELIAGESREVPWFGDRLWDQATPEQLEQSAMERELGMEVGITARLHNSPESPVIAGVGLCMLPVSKKEFASYWEHSRAEILDLCNVLDFGMRSQYSADFVGLSPRELEFLTLLGGGYSQKQIAAKWHRSTHTLEHHSRNCRLKLKAGNLEQAVYKAFVLGLIKP